MRYFDNYTKLSV